MSSKSKITEQIKETLAHLRSQPDPFGYIKNDVETLQRLISDLRSYSSERNKMLEQVTKERDELLTKQKEHDAELKEAEEVVKEASQKIAAERAKVNSAMALAANIVTYHDNFRMESLQSKLGDEYNTLRKKCLTVARDMAEALRKRKSDPASLAESFFKLLDEVQDTASRREDLIYEAARKTVVNFGVFLAAALEKHGAIIIDENTVLGPMEFTVDGTFPRCSVRFCDKDEKSDTSGIDTKTESKILFIARNIAANKDKNYSDTVRELADTVLKEFGE